MNCETCKKEHNGSYGSGRFCNRKCSNNRGTRTQETRDKISKALGGIRIFRICEVCKNQFLIKKQKDFKRKFCNTKCKNVGQKKGLRTISSILECSKRTAGKILRRLGMMKCSKCGWDKGTCDLHHIRGKKILNPDHHSNITLICPNCHRLAHEGKIKCEELITLETFLGVSWHDMYLG